MNDLMNHRLHVCPPEFWDTGIDYVISTLKSNGMTAESRVLDVGCGCLRLGKPLIEFLNANGYAGVEPCAPILHDGIVKELGEEELGKKNPVFLYSPEFDFSPLKGPFTHVIAHDVFIHCGMAQLGLFLKRVAAVTDQGSKILMTVIIGDVSSTVGKSSLSNTPEEKATTSRFLYAHADNNTTVYSLEDFSEVISRHGFECRSLAKFPRGLHTKHAFLVTFRN